MLGPISNTTTSFCANYKNYFLIRTLERNRIYLNMYVQLTVFEISYADSIINFYPGFFVYKRIKVLTSPSKKIIFFNERPLKMMRNAFYFTLKTVFVLKIFKFLY